MTKIKEGIKLVAGDIKPGMTLHGEKSAIRKTIEMNTVAGKAQPIVKFK